jgi:hypothetical protein
MGELGGNTVLVEDHLDRFAQVSESLFRGVAVAVGPAGRPEPGMCAPDAILILFKGIRDVHYGHASQSTRVSDYIP